MLTHYQEVQAILDIAATDEPSRIYAADGIHVVRELEGARLIEEASLRPDSVAQYHYVQLRNAEKAVRDAGDRWEDLARFALDRAGALAGNVLDVLVHGGGPKKKEDIVDYSPDRICAEALISFVRRMPESTALVGRACMTLRETLLDSGIDKESVLFHRRALGTLWMDLDDAVGAADGDLTDPQIQALCADMRKLLEQYSGTATMLFDHLFMAALEG